jgi:hypothetical protein
VTYAVIRHAGQIAAGEEFSGVFSPSFGHSALPAPFRARRNKKPGLAAQIANIGGYCCLGPKLHCSHLHFLGFPEWGIPRPITCPGQDDQGIPGIQEARPGRRGHGRRPGRLATAAAADRRRGRRRGNSTLVMPVPAELLRCVRPHSPAPQPGRRHPGHRRLGAARARYTRPPGASQHRLDRAAPKHQPPSDRCHTRFPPQPSCGGNRQPRVAGTAVNRHCPDRASAAFGVMFMVKVGKLAAGPRPRLAAEAGRRP